MDTILDHLTLERASTHKGWLQNAKLKKIQKDKSDLGATWVSQ